MNILGIGPGELLLILFILLVVVGPQRLPELARQLAHLLVRVRNWIQHSPDAALVLRARQEIEQELASIKASLLEFQSVRDEVMGAARQIEDTVGTLMSPGPLDPINPPLSIDAEQPGDHGVHALPTDIGRIAPEPGPEPGPSPVHRGTSPVPVSQAQIEELNVRLQAVMSDLWALQSQLRLRGVLDDDWQPPSYTLQLDQVPPADVSPPTAAPVHETPGQPRAAADLSDQEAPDAY